MKAKILMMALVTLMLTNCQKTDIAPDSDAISDANARIATSATTNECDVLNFTTGNGFSSVDNALIFATSEDGVVVGVSGDNPQAPPTVNSARIFNSSNPHPEDVDLGTPNAMYGGPGQPSGAASNNTALGNIVII